jgi:hypothetical protein
MDFWMYQPMKASSKEEEMDQHQSLDREDANRQGERVRPITAPVSPFVPPYTMTLATESHNDISNLRCSHGY